MPVSKPRSTGNGNYGALTLRHRTTNHGCRLRVVRILYYLWAINYENSTNSELVVIQSAPVGTVTPEGRVCGLAFDALTLRKRFLATVVIKTRKLHGQTNRKIAKKTKHPNS